MPAVARTQLQGCMQFREFMHPFLALEITHHSTQQFWLSLGLQVPGAPTGNPQALRRTQTWWRWDLLRLGDWPPLERSWPFWFFEQVLLSIKVLNTKLLVLYGPSSPFFQQTSPL